MQLLRQLHPPTKGSEWARVQGARSAAPCALPVWGDETRDPRQGHYRHCHGRLRYETPGMAGASWHAIVVHTHASSPAELAALQYKCVLLAGLGERRRVPDRLTSTTFSALPISRGRIAGRSVLYAYPAISRPPYWHRNAMLKRVLELYRYWLTALCHSRGCCNT